MELNQVMSLTGIQDRNVIHEGIVDKINRIESEGYTYSDTTQEVFKTALDTYLGNGNFDSYDYYRIKGEKMNIMTFTNDEGKNRYCIFKDNGNIVNNSLSSLRMRDKWCRENAYYNYFEHIEKMSEALNKRGINLGEENIFWGILYNGYPNKDLYDRYRDNTDESFDYDKFAEDFDDALTHDLVSMENAGAEYKQWAYHEIYECGQDREAMAMRDCFPNASDYFRTSGANSSQTWYFTYSLLKAAGDLYIQYIKSDSIYADMNTADLLSVREKFDEEIENKINNLSDKKEIAKIIKEAYHLPDWIIDRATKHITENKGSIDCKSLSKIQKVVSEIYKMSASLNISRQEARNAVNNTVNYLIANGTKENIDKFYSEYYKTGNFSNLNSIYKVQAVINYIKDAAKDGADIGALIDKSNIEGRQDQNTAITEEAKNIIRYKLEKQIIETLDEQTTDREKIFAINHPKQWANCEIRGVYQDRKEEPIAYGNRLPDSYVIRTFMDYGDFSLSDSCAEKIRTFKENYEASITSQLKERFEQIKPELDMVSVDGFGNDANIRFTTKEGEAITLNYSTIWRELIRDMDETFPEIQKTDFNENKCYTKEIRIGGDGPGSFDNLGGYKNYYYGSHVLFSEEGYRDSEATTAEGRKWAYNAFTNFSLCLSDEAFTDYCRQHQTAVEIIAANKEQFDSKNDFYDRCNLVEHRLEKQSEKEDKNLGTETKDVLKNAKDILARAGVSLDADRDKINSALKTMESNKSSDVKEKDTKSIDETAI